MKQLTRVAQFSIWVALALTVFILHGALLVVLNAFGVGVGVKMLIGALYAGGAVYVLMKVWQRLFRYVK